MSLDVGSQILLKSPASQSNSKCDFTVVSIYITSVHQLDNRARQLSCTVRF